MSKKKSVAIQITDDSLKFVELVLDKNQIRLGRFDTFQIKDGIVSGGYIKKPTDFKKILTTFKKKIGITPLSVSFVPDQMLLAELFKSAGFKDLYFESISVSLERLIPKRKTDEAFMSVYFGDKRTEIAVIEKKEIEFMTAFDFGRKILEFISDKGSMLSMVGEKIDEQFVSWHTDKNKRHKTLPMISKIFFSGELPELSVISRDLGPMLRMPTETLSVWGSFVDFDVYIPEMTQSESLFYAVPIGLALRQFEK